MSSQRPSRLSADEITVRLKSRPAWRLDNARGDAIVRELRFRDFKQAFAFMTEVALSAQAMDHHPEWTNVYSQVVMRLSTHDAGGVTEMDFMLADAVDSAAAPRV